MKATNLRKQALISGVSLILMTIIAGIAMGLIYAPLFEMSSLDFVSDFNAISELLSVGFLLWCLILILDYTVSFSLCKFYAAENARLAKWMAVFRLVYSIILTVAVYFLFQGTYFAEDATAAFHSIKMFYAVWKFGLIVFGLHLVLLSLLVWSRQTILKVLSLLIIIAGLGYISTNCAEFILKDYASIRGQVESIFMLPMILGEFSLALYLVVRGGKEGRIKKQFAS